MRRRLYTALSHIHMWIGAIHNQHIGVVDHFLRNICMQVQRRDDRYTRPNNLPQTRQQGAIRVNLLSGDGRTVQCPAHGLKFDLATGCMRYGNGLGVRSYAVSLVDGMAVITLPDSPSEEPAI